MAEIQFTGLTSGIDSAAIVQQLMTIESRRLATYQVDQNDYGNQLDAVDELRAKINSLKSAAASLADTDSMGIYNATSSDNDVLSVSASSEATAGSHSVAINQLATADTWIQEASPFNYETDYVGGGVFIYSYHNQERVITTVEDETKLEDLVNLINNDEDNPGVSASLLYQGGTYHLMLSGQETGEDYQISVNTSSTEVWKPDEDQPNSTFTKEQDNAGLTTKITDLDQFSGTLGAGDAIIISGKNHAGVNLPDTTLSVTTNTTVEYLIDAINTHFEGAATARLENGQIWLTDNASGASDLEISLSYSGDATLGLPTMAVAEEGGSTVASLTSLDASSFIETQNAQNAKLRIDGYPAGSQDEVQTLAITGGTPTTGSFKLTLNGETTVAINFNWSATDIENALLGLEGVESGDISVDGTNLASGDISIQFAGNLAGTDVTKMTVSEAGTMDAGIVSVTETVKGNDGWLHRNSNTITNALTGITLNLQDVTEVDNPIKVAVSRSTSLISKKMQTLVSTYNELMGALKTNTEYDSESKSMGILSRDISVTALKSNARSPFTTMASGFLDTLDVFSHAEDIGITLDGAGMMEFDSGIFDDAINEDYRGVLDLLGATASGNSSNSAIQFYGASEKYTTAGTYHVKVEVDSNNEIISAKIKLSGETEYRDAKSWKNNIIFFDDTFVEGEPGKPVNPEHSLQLTVDLKEGVYGTDENPVIIHVKQGIFGELEDLLNDMVKTSGLLETSEDALDKKIELMQDKIDREDTRLGKIEKRLTAKYARLEATLARLQEQQSAVSAMLG